MRISEKISTAFAVLLIFSFFSTYQKQLSYDILIDVCVSSNAYENTILLKMSNKSQVRMSAICFHQLKRRIVNKRVLR